MHVEAAGQSLLLHCCLQEGRGEAGLGALLWTFLRRYGCVFDYAQHAVAVGRGGVVPVHSLALPPLAQDRGLRICVQDPHTLRSGRLLPCYGL